MRLVEYGCGPTCLLNMRIIVSGQRRRSPFTVMDHTKKKICKLNMNSIISKAGNQDFKLSSRARSPTNSYGQISYRWKALNASKHEALSQCWVNIGPPSATMAQH